MKLNNKKLLYLSTAITWPILCFTLGGLVSYIILQILEYVGVNVDTNALIPRILFTIVSVASVISILLLAHRYIGKNLYIKSLAFNSFKPKYIYLALLIIILALALNYSFDYIVQSTQLTFDDTRNARAFTSSNVIDLMSNLLIAGLLTAILEEILFRGYMYGNLKTIMNKFSASIVTSITFGLMHFDIVYLPFLIIFSFLLIYLREKTGSIVPGILVHASYNSLIIFFAYLNNF